MRRHFSLMVTLLAAASLAIATRSAHAVPPSAVLLPSTTKAYVSIPNMEETRKKFDETQLGQLLKDPIMEPFAKDLERQFNEKLTKTGVKLAIKLTDLEGIASGEVCIAGIQPENDATQHAMALIVDVTGRIDEAKALLVKVEKDLAAQGGMKKLLKEGAVVITSYEVPRRRMEVGSIHAYYAIVGDQLIAADHEAEMRHIVARAAGTLKDKPLTTLPAFATTMERVNVAGGEAQPHVRWFVEPFGYAEVSRAATGGRKKRGKDLIRILANQGFTAIQGLAGQVIFTDGEHDVLHRTFIYAPAKGNFELAARMLEFENKDSARLTAQTWIPRDAASYMSFKWNMKDAFWYSETLVDEVVGTPGAFADVIKALRLDPQGPRIDIRTELIDHLSDRASIVTDYDKTQPINPKSERLLIALEITNPAVVKRTLDKAMESDPAAKKRTFGEYVIWEILNEEGGEDIRGPMIDGPGFGPLGDEDEDSEVAEEEKPVLPNSAVTVAYGHLIVASHVDYIRTILEKADAKGTLSDAADYKVIIDALDALGGGGTNSFRVFARTDEAYRVTYELLRQGKMPESESVLGKLLNQMLGPDEEGVLREQQLDGSKLPEYDAVRRYLGPTGVFVTSEKDGWFVTGCLLTKEIETP